MTISEKGNAASHFVHEITHHLTHSKLAYYRNLICAPVDLNSDTDLRLAFGSELEITSTIKKDANGQPISTDTWIAEGLRQGYGDHDLVYFNPFFAVDRRLVEIRGREYYQKQAEENLEYARRQQEANNKRSGQEIQIPMNSALIKIVTTSVNTKITNKSWIGYAGKNYAEFLSRCSQIYYTGKDRFFHEFVKFFGEDKTKKLYDAIKEHMYSQKEFKAA